MPASNHRNSAHNLDRQGWLSMAHLYAKRGNELPHAKLTPERVTRIRNDYVKGSRTHGAPALARREGLHVRTIEKVLARETWCHV